MEDQTKQSITKGGSLCVLMDEAGWPIHIKKIDNDPAAFKKFCRDETIFSLIHEATEAPFYMIGRADYSDMGQIPEISKDNFSEKWRELENMTDSNDKGPLSISLQCLCGFVDELIRNMSDEKLREYSYLTVPKSAVPGCLCGCNLADINFVQDVVRQNGYSEYFLAQTSKGNWLFDQTNAGQTAIKNFIQFLETNYFDSRLEIDQLTRSVVWLHKSEIPKDLNNFNPRVYPDKILFPKTDVYPDEYIRYSLITNHLRPTPESYWRNFMSFKPSPNNILATVLAIEQSGYAPRSKLEDLLCSDFSVENENFCSEIRKMMQEKGGPDILSRLKTMAAQIINDTGISIRGRDQPAFQHQENRNERVDSSFSPKVRGGRHV